MTDTLGHTQRPCIAALPTELLHIILGYAFHNHHQPAWSILVWLGSNSLVKQVAPTDALSPQNPPAVLRVCRRFHSEGWSVLLEGGVLALSLFSDCDEPVLDSMLKWFEEKGAQWLLRRVRMVRMIGGWPSANWASPGRLVSLRRVVIRLGVTLKVEVAGDGGRPRKRLEDLLNGNWPERRGSWESMHAAGRRKVPFSVEQGRQLLIVHDNKQLLMTCSVDLRDKRIISASYRVHSDVSTSRSESLLHCSVNNTKRLSTIDEALEYVFGHD